MKTIRTIGALALVAVSAAACEDITNPIEEFGSLEEPYVRFADSRIIGTPGSTVDVVIQLPTRVEEEVTVEYSFGGDAVFGEDFIPVDANGDPRGDVTASGGSETIPFLFDDTAIPAATLRVFVPFDATDGAVLTVQLESATTASGRELAPGFIPQFSNFDLSIEGFVTEGVATGNYAGTIAGDLVSGDLAVTVTQPATPVVIDGAEFSFVISDYAGGVFGVPVPWAFNVTSGGTAIFAPVDAAGFGVTSDLTGSYDFGSANLEVDVVLTCCGAAGAGWTLDLTAQ